jgi:hypothetical protein
MAAATEKVPTSTGVSVHHGLGVVGVRLLAVLPPGPRGEAFGLLHHSADDPSRAAVGRGHVDGAQVAQQGVA